MKMSDILSPGNIEDVIGIVTSHGTGWILLFVLVSMFIENIFPPYPGDAAIFAAGFIAGSGKVSVMPVLILSMIGSIASIMVLHAIGWRYGKRIFAGKFLRFLKPESLPRIESWFQKYGNTVLVASRFLAGTRALIALSAGVGRVGHWRMLILSGISVIIWNCLVILSAYSLQNHWQSVYDILSTYNRAVFVVVIAAILVFAGYKLTRRLRSR